MRVELLQGFERQLRTRKKELQDVIAGNEAILREQLIPDESRDTLFDANHPADMNSADPDYDKQIEIIRRERAELALVSSALARIDRGTFGDCESCREEIPIERLEAIPYTKYCITCRQEKELEAQDAHRAFGGADPHAVGNLGL